MKIAYLVDEFPSMSQTFILRQIIGMIDAGHSVYIFADRPSNADKMHAQYEKYNLIEKTYYHNVPQNKLVRILNALLIIIQCAPQNFSAVARSLNIFKYGIKALSLELIFLIIPFLKKGPFDIIHCQFGTLGLKGMLLKQIGAVKCKMVTSIRGFDITQYLRKNPGAYNELFSECDLFLPVSKTFSQLLVDEGCHSYKIVVHHSGIDCSKIKYIERHCMDGEPIKILTVARLVEKKGIAYAIKAVARLVNEGKQLSYKIIGDGILRESLQHLIKELGIEKQVELSGWKTQEEVLHYLQEAHVMIAPSITTSDNDQEGIPNVLKEAMASGIPVISTWHSAIPELVQDGISGFLVPEGDVDAIADKLRYLIDHTEIWTGIGLAGRVCVEKYYDINMLNKRLEDLYQHQINGTAIQK